MMINFSFNKMIHSYINGVINMVPTKSWIQFAGAAIGALSSLSASRSARKGAGAAAAAQMAGVTEQGRQYDIGQEHLRPYREAGEWGLGRYQQALSEDAAPRWGGFGLEQMQEDPGYQFRLEQGYQGLDRMAARAGQRMSGARGIGLMDYGQRMASQEFGAARGRSLEDYGLQRTEYMDRMSQLANLASAGQQAAGASSTLGANYAESIAASSRSLGQTYQQAAQAQAAGAMGVGSAIQGGLAGYQYQQNFDRYAGGLGGYGGTSAQVAGDAYAPAYWR